MVGSSGSKRLERKLDNGWELVMINYKKPRVSKYGKVKQKTK